MLSIRLSLILVAACSGPIVTSYTGFSLPHGRTAQPQMVIYDVHNARPETLTRTLPPRFLPKLQETHYGLLRLCNGNHPTVLNRVELNEKNVHVDTATGRITGVIDWLDAVFGSFGWSLWAMDIALGASPGPDGIGTLPRPSFASTFGAPPLMSTIAPILSMAYPLRDTRTPSFGHSRMDLGIHHNQVS